MNKYNIMVKGILRYEDKYLVVQKWYDDRIQNPYQWDFIDGKLEFGESPDKEVVRLIQEATGLSADIERILYTWSYMVGDIWNIGISYVCLTPISDVILSEELNDYKWITKEEIADYIENEAIMADIEKAEL